MAVVVCNYSFMQAAQTYTLDQAAWMHLSNSLLTVMIDVRLKL